LLYKSLVNSYLIANKLDLSIHTQGKTVLSHSTARIGFLIDLTYDIGKRFYIT